MQGLQRPTLSVRGPRVQLSSWNRKRVPPICRSRGGEAVSGTWSKQGGMDGGGGTGGSSALGQEGGHSSSRCRLGTQGMMNDLKTKAQVDIIVLQMRICLRTKYRFCELGKYSFLNLFFPSQTAFEHLLPGGLKKRI